MLASQSIRLYERKHEAQILGDHQVDTFSKPAVERLQSRLRRRSLVCVWLANMLGIILVCWTWPAAWLVWGPMFLLLFPLVSLLNMSVRGVTEIPLSHLDERQAQLRMRAFHDAFPVAIAVALLSGIAMGHVWLASDRSGEYPFVFGVILGTVATTLHRLPVMILAWCLPDEIDGADAL
jgi:hypothetical protein